GVDAKVGDPGGRGEVRCLVRVERVAAAPERGGERDREHRGDGDLPQLHARRAVRVAAQGAPHQLLRLRLRVLHQPAVELRGARAVQGGRGGEARPRLLPPELHRGAVPLVGHHPQLRLHHGAAGAGGEDAATRPRLRRLHPPQDDPRGERGADRRGGALGRPAEHQRRAAHAGGARRARAGEVAAHDPPLDDGHPRRDRRGEERARRRLLGAAVRAGGPEHADDRGRHRRHRPRDPHRVVVALRARAAAARVLLGVLADPRLAERAAERGAAARARAPAVPGRLADALLRLRRRRAHLGGRAEPQPARGPEARLGAPQPRELPRGREPGDAGRAAAHPGRGRQERRAHPADPPVAPRAARRPRAAPHLDAARPPLPRHRRLPPAPARPRRRAAGAARGAQAVPARSVRGAGERVLGAAL
ncbi:MAG: Biotin synthase related domain containing protein, partial [uncultured Gemmatimonadaceae bacterium]